MVLVLFLCPSQSRTENNREFQRKVENVGEGLIKSTPTAKNTLYLCNVFRDKQPISERAILRKAGANYNYVTHKKSYRNRKRHHRRQCTSSAVADKSVPNAKHDEEGLSLHEPLILKKEGQNKSLILS